MVPDDHLDERETVLASAFRAGNVVFVARSVNALAPAAAKALIGGR
jgi:hypothetical protein